MSAALARDTWLACPAPDPRARLRLFFLPYAGGGVAPYRRWLAALPADVEAWLVQLPGREKRFRERPFDRMAALLAELAPVLEPLLDRPFAFFGHSMGALIAYELARELRRRGRPEPEHLLASARGAPDRQPATGPRHDLPDAAFLEQLRRLGGTPAEVLENRELLEMFLPLLRADFALAETYSWTAEPPLGCAITALGGAEDPAWPAEGLELWRRHTTGPFRLHLFEGNHFFLHSAEGLLLERLREALAPPPAWQAVSGPPDLAGHEVHVWRTPLEQPPEYLQSLWQMLAPEELQRANRFHFDKDRRHYVACRGVLRLLLGRYLGREPSGLTFAYNPQGKPRLAGDEAGRLCFNVSHSHGLALIAVARGREIGVDVERIRPEFAGERVAERFFSPVEVAELRALAEPERMEAFFACWTRKEAYLKATGMGLSLPLDCFDVSLTPGEAALKATRHDPAAIRRWSLRDLAPGPGYAGALAVEGHGWRLWCANWPG
jgi:medium-chain acyl-[acyl-carrier-protein] hydrolase